MDKLELVRSMLSPRSLYRQTPEVAHLLTATVIDNQITEVELLEKLAQRLLHLRMAKLLLAQLKFARFTSANLSRFVELPSYYAKLFEWAVDEIGQGWTYFQRPFLLCPYIMGSL